MQFVIFFYKSIFPSQTLQQSVAHVSSMYFVPFVQLIDPGNVNTRPRRSNPTSSLPLYFLIDGSDTVGFLPFSSFIEPIDPANLNTRGGCGVAVSVQDLNFFFAIRHF
jgi:hypothetical protein